MDLSNLSAAQLRELEQKLPNELKRREAEEKVRVLGEVRAFAKARGYTLEELMIKEPKVKVGGAGKVRVKYRHPQNSELEWTGRGRKPKWVEAWLADGGQIENLLV